MQIIAQLVSHLLWLLLKFRRRFRPRKTRNRKERQKHPKIVSLLVILFVVINTYIYIWLRQHIICATSGPIKFFHRMSKKAFTITYKVEQFSALFDLCFKITLACMLTPPNRNCSGWVARVEGVQGDFFQIYLFHRLVQGASLNWALDYVCNF